MHRARTLCGIGLAALVLAAPAAASIEGKFERSLSVSGPVKLWVSSGSGSIAVRSGADGTVRITGAVRGNTWSRWSQDEVSRAVRAVEAKPPVVQQGSQIRVGELEDKELAQRVSISYEITVPADTAVASHTGSGSQTIASVKGPVTAASGSGSLRIGSIQGPVEARTGSGSIDVDGARQSVSASSGSGSVEIGTVTGSATARTGSGAITIKQVSDGTVDVTTGSGSIEVADLRGGLNARTGSGSIEVSGAPTAAWEAHSSSGQITLTIPQGTAFRLQASTSSGSINTEHQLTVSSMGRRQLVASSGEGGALINARTASGSIHINRR